jgi:ketosteroid isomerase-like protein
MKYIALALLLACTVTTLSHAHEPTLTTADKVRIEAEVRQAVADYISVVKSRDMEKIYEFWGDFDDFVHAGDGRVMGDRATWLSWIETHPVDEFLSWVNTDIHVAVLALNAASYTMNFEVVTVTDGKESRATGSWTYVMRKADNSWRVVHSNGKHNEFSYYD